MLPDMFCPLLSALIPQHLNIWWIYLLGKIKNKIVNFENTSFLRGDVRLRFG
jgi:hypothetical protein